MWKPLAAAGLLLLAAIGLAQTVQKPSPRLGRPTERLPWTRFWPAAEPYKPTAEERQKIESKLSELDAMIRDLKSRRVDEQLLADVEIYAEAARWKLENPQEFAVDHTERPCRSRLPV
jgi:hypothetical protein